jgi:hypothetical protein
MKLLVRILACTLAVFALSALAALAWDRSDQVATSPPTASVR